jgi:predicted RNA binding protein YcfA (HicA-like mRNA interferase family)
MKTQSGKKTVQMLQDLGWFIVATEGSHTQMRHPEKPGRVTVPLHGNENLPIGTYLSIMRQAGLK